MSHSPGPRLSYGAWHLCSGEKPNAVPELRPVARESRSPPEPFAWAAHARTPLLWQPESRHRPASLLYRLSGLRGLGESSRPDFRVGVERKITRCPLTVAVRTGVAPKNPQDYAPRRTSHIHEITMWHD